MLKKRWLACLMVSLAFAAGWTLCARGAGASGTSIVTPSEVAMLSGYLNPGEVVPLPVYADGTVASESECRWIVSKPTDAGGGAWCFTADAYYGVQFLPEQRPTDRSFLEAHKGRVVNSGQSGNSFGAPVSFLIIATRQANQPTSARQATWGQVKARYR
jgi:hypothetical protein